VFLQFVYQIAKLGFVEIGFALGAIKLLRGEVEGGYGVGVREGWRF
jgi:hypothetical protein